MISVVNEPVHGTKVTFVDQTGSRSVDAVVSPSVPIRRILPNVITKLSLPVMGPDGQPISYSLDHRESGRRLRETLSLPEAGVQNGDHLVVFPEMIAG